MPQYVNDIPVEKVPLNHLVSEDYHLETGILTTYVDSGIGLPVVNYIFIHPVDQESEGIYILGVDLVLKVN